MRGNAAADVEKFPQQQSGEIEVFSPEEIWALVRAAGSEQDTAIFLTAAFTGLRMGELLALRWRDVDFAGQTIRVRASYYAGQLTTPKSGKVRALPMSPDVATPLAQLGRRVDWVGDDDLVFGTSGPPRSMRRSSDRRAPPKRLAGVEGRVVRASRFGRVVHDYLVATGVVPDGMAHARMRSPRGALAARSRTAVGTA